MATWQHLRSSTANKRPTTSLADGRIAINTNTASPGLFFKDSAGTGIVKVGPVHVGTTAPNSVPAAGGSSGNYTGEQWLDTSVSPAQMKVWNGSTWVGIVADELPVSKLQDGAARQLIQTDAAGTGVEWTSDIDVPGTLDVTSTATFDSIAQHPLGTAGAPTITFAGDNNTGIYSPGADQVAISTGGSGRLFVDASGRVGVNTASPQRALHLVGSDGPVASFPTIGAKDYLVVENNGNANISIVGGATSGSSLKFFASGNNSPFSTITSDYTNGNLALVSNSSVTLSTASSERLRITSAGLVGVGTSSVSYKLDINNTSGGNGGFRLLSTDQSTTRIRLENTGVGGRSYEIVGGLTGVDNSTFTVYDATAAATRLAIDSSGRVGIGTTSPAFKLDVSHSGDNNAARFYQSGASANTDIYINNVGSANNFIISRRSNGESWLFNSGTDPLVFLTNATERARIDSSGRLLVGTSSDSGGALLQVNGDRIRVGTAKTPASATATGTAGEICWDASYVYVCTATNTWKRSALSTW